MSKAYHRKHYLKNRQRIKDRVRNQQRTVHGFLTTTHASIRRRVKNISKGAYGLPVSDKEDFLNWGKNHPVFLELWQTWTEHGHDFKLTPTACRILPLNGFTLENLEWRTASENAILTNHYRNR